MHLHHLSAVIRFAEKNSQGVFIPFCFNLILLYFILFYFILILFYFILFYLV